MAKSKTEKTKAPSGLKISRSGEKFTLSWKIGDANYSDGQYFQYIINDTGKDSWKPSKNTGIGKTTTEKSIKIDKDDFYPVNAKKKLRYVGMRVKGNRKKYTTGSGKKKKTHNPGVSDWSSKNFNLKVPKKPSLTATLDNELSNVCKFEWATATSNSDVYMFTDVEWQTVLVKNSAETDGSKVSWKGATFESGSSTANNSRTITEDTSILYQNGDSYVRWFRVRSRGPRGHSKWRYAHHTYALPNRAAIVKNSVSAVPQESGGYQVSLKWEAAANIQNPIDRTIVQYTICIPASGLSVPVDASWTDANISSDTESEDAAVFVVDSSLSLDQCLFVRVNTQHDNNITYGIPALAEIGSLKDPTNLSVQTVDATHRATITCTNASDVPDSVLVVKYVPKKGATINCGIIPHGETSVTVQCPNWSNQASYGFQVYAMVGTTTKQVRTDGVDSYAVNARMRSAGTLKQGGTIPVVPGNVTVNRVSGKPDTIEVTWDWSWGDANSAEISWSDHDDAWESTDQPDTYVIDSLYAGKWRISGLETGKTWYVRVRLISGNLSSSEDVTYGPWSSIKDGTIDLSSAPNKPLLTLSNPIISKSGKTVASWVYTTTDGTDQAYAEIGIVSGANYIPIAHAETAQHLEISGRNLTNGVSYNLVCWVKSKSGRISDRSDPVALTIAQPLTCSITQTSLVNETHTRTATDVVSGETETFSVTEKTLKSLPLTVTVSGSGDGGITSVSIERLKSYYLDRPNEDKFIGHEGESIAVFSQIGSAQISIGLDDLIGSGSLDDGAEYRLIATVMDGLGQTDSAELDFVVHWTDQAIVPSATVIMDQEDLIAKITPIAPTGARQTDVADIYRLSIDKPELIVQGGEFGETYVDPYPALGDMGGYRIVLRTINGDYITEDNTIASVDSGELGVNPIDNEDLLNIIDFDGKQIKFYWGNNYSNTWEKDIQENEYLGGSTQIDWNAAVSRTGTLSSRAITVLDQEMLQAVRRLAEYTGICHVRTADGSSYAADVQVSEDYTEDEQGMVTNYSLSITRTDSQEFDGMTLDQYEAEMSEEEES